MYVTLNNKFSFLSTDMFSKYTSSSKSMAHMFICSMREWHNFSYDIPFALLWSQDFV